MSPPSSGPSVAPSPDPAPQRPTARARFSGSLYAEVTIASEAGRTSGGPSPCTTLPAISHSTVGASADQSDPREKSRRPASSAARRP